MLAPEHARAYDYLEHSYFADRACRLSQELLAARIRRGAADEKAVTRYLALAVVCPNRWDQPYCADGYKVAEANINRLEAPPLAGHDLSLTLGDLAALPDHISSYGPVAGLPAPAERQSGLSYRVFRWLTGKPRGIGGIIGDVAEDACETDVVPWTRLETDVRAFLEAEIKNGDLPQVPSRFFTPITRAPINRGARDPAALYSFDNPHFLDLVLRDTDHFGTHAYTSWLGFHSTALVIAGRSCPEVLGFDDDALEDLADDLPAFEDVDWDALPPAEMRTRGCALLAEGIRRRLVEWAERADPALVDPVRDRIDHFRSPVRTASGDPGDPQGNVGSGGDRLDSGRTPQAEVHAQLEPVAAAVLALVFEGSGLHFLQDGLAAGHMRESQLRRGLGERRWDHDLDNRNGVVALLNTASGEHRFVAFGDTWLSGPPLLKDPVCDWQKLDLDGTSREQVSDCLLQHHRGVLVATTASSLLDWALGGFMYGDEWRLTAPCDRADEEQRFLCWNLPLQATRVPGQEVATVHSARLHHGVLPVPQPPFRYQSLTVTAGLDAGGSGNQLGLTAALYSTLGPNAGWLTSYRAGLRSSLGPGAPEEFVADLSYGFHWRWSARFLVDGEPFIYAGLRGIRTDRSLVMGVGPMIGVTGLPEGWVKIPLELSLSYRMPITLVTSDRGFFGESIGIDGHWIQFSLGLAFM